MTDRTQKLTNQVLPYDNGESRLGENIVRRHNSGEFVPESTSLNLGQGMIILDLCKCHAVFFAHLQHFYSYDMKAETKNKV